MIWFRSANSHTGPQLHRCIRGRTDGSIRLCANLLQKSKDEYSLSAKWLELLKQIAPSVTRVAVIRNSDNPAGLAVFGAIQNAAQSLSVEVSPVGVSVRDAGELERIIAAFARSPNGGLVVTQTASAIQRDLISTVAARYKLPAVYSLSYNVPGCALISYGPDVVAQFRQAAGYVDRILKGEKPADLPVQAPTKYELVINLRSVKALGIKVSRGH